MLEKLAWLISSAAPGGSRLLMLVMLNYSSVGEADDFVRALNLGNFLATFLSLGFGFIAIKLISKSGFSKNIMQFGFYGTFLPGVVISFSLYCLDVLTLGLSFAILVIPVHIFMRHIYVGMKLPAVIVAYEIVFFTFFSICFFQNILSLFFIFMTIFYLLVVFYYQIRLSNETVIMKGDYRTALEVGLSNVVTSGLLFLFPLIISEMSPAINIKEISLLFSISGVAMIVSRAYLTSKLSDLNHINLNELHLYLSLNAKIVAFTFMLCLVINCIVVYFTMKADLYPVAILTSIFLSVGQYSSVLLSYYSFKEGTKRVLVINLFTFLVSVFIAYLLWVVDVFASANVVMAVFIVVYIFRHIWIYREVYDVRVIR